MTVKQLIEKTAAPITIVDGNQKYFVSPWGLLYDTFGNLEITLKTQLVKE